LEEAPRLFETETWQCGDLYEESFSSQHAKALTSTLLGDSTSVVVARGWTHSQRAASIRRMVLLATFCSLQRGGLQYGLVILARMISQPTRLSSICSPSAVSSCKWYGSAIYYIRISWGRCTWNFGAHLLDVDVSAKCWRGGLKRSYSYCSADVPETNVCSSDAIELRNQVSITTTLYDNNMFQMLVRVHYCLPPCRQSAKYESCGFQDYCGKDNGAPPGRRQVISGTFIEFQSAIVGE